MNNENEIEFDALFEFGLYNENGQVYAHVEMNVDEMHYQTQIEFAKMVREGLGHIIEDLEKLEVSQQTLQ